MVHLDSRTVLTSQLFFDEGVTDAVYARAPYTVHSGRDMFNRNDSIFDDRLMLTLREEGMGTSMSCR